MCLFTYLLLIGEILYRTLVLISSTLLKYEIRQPDKDRNASKRCRRVFIAGKSDFTSSIDRFWIIFAPLKRRLLTSIHGKHFMLAKLRSDSDIYLKAVVDWH